VTSPWSIRRRLPTGAISIAVGAWLRFLRVAVIERFYLGMTGMLRVRFSSSLDVPATPHNLGLFTGDSS
jgi:hypothetical protein